MLYTITESQLASYEEKGYLIIKDALSTSEINALQTWVQAIHDLPRTQDCQYIHYDEINQSGERVLCRTENFADSHAEFGGLLRGDKLLGILEQLSGEAMLLFKEKSMFGAHRTKEMLTQHIKSISSSPAPVASNLTSIELATAPSRRSSTSPSSSLWMLPTLPMAASKWSREATRWLFQLALTTASSQTGLKLRSGSPWRWKPVSVPTLYSSDSS